MPGVGGLEATWQIKNVLPPVEILRLLTGGATNKDLASALSTSESTVKNHLRTILEKLYLENHTQAAAISFQLRSQCLSAV
jgi:DNA-binding NarL/FixJ family response regulator